MREQSSRHVTMAVPAPGFTSRVMTRIQERERRAARRRALAGACLLALAGFVPIVLGGFVFVDALTDMSSHADLLTSGFVLLSPALSLAETIVMALWLGSTAVMTVGSGQLLAYAIAVLALTLLWVRVAGGSFQLSPHTVDMGGSE